MTSLARLAAVALALSACSAEVPMPADAGARSDSGPSDASTRADGSDPSALDGSGPDASTPDASLPATLGAHRDRLLATLDGAPCASWAALDASQRAVFLTLTHRLFVSHAPDGLPMLAHVTRVYLVLGGGSSGTSCGGAENNRLFLAIDDELHARLSETWDGAGAITDGDGTTWIHTRDSAGPHDPFDASVETDTGLRCTLLFETAGSRPPTAQAHFFLEGSAVPIERGDGISLPADPRMLEIDHDYNCLHDSNPTCRDFADRYREHHGDFECEWVPSDCVAVGTGCYRSVTIP